MLWITEEIKLYRLKEKNKNYFRTLKNIPGGNMDLKRRAFGLAFGTMPSLSVFLGTFWLLIMDSESDFFSKF